MARLPHVLLVALMVVGAAACGDGPPDGSPGGPAALGGRTFLSVAVTERGAPRPLVAATQVRLDFRGDGTLGASAGCNSMGGTWRLDGARLLVRNGGMTAMGCDPELHEQDAWLADFLASGPAVAFGDDRLALSDGGTVIQLADEEVVTPDRALVGTRWVVDGIRTGDTVSSSPVGAAASIHVAQDGTATVETGCNTGRTVATVEGDELRFEDLALTRRACVDRGVGALERAVLAVVAAPSVTWSVQVDRLTLDAGDTGLLLRAG